MSSRRVDITPDVYVSVFDDGRIELCARKHNLKPGRGGVDPRPGRGSRYSFTLEPREDARPSD